MRRRPLAQRILRAAVPGATLVALLGTSVAMALPDSDKGASTSTATTQAGDLDAGISRDLDVRPPLDERIKEVDIKPVAKGEKYSTAGALNVRTEPNDNAKVLTELKRSTKVPVTGNEDGKWAEIIYKDEARWVTAKYLSDEKPPPLISDAPCASGSGVESGVQPDTIRVHRAVCALFGSVTNYGGLGGGGEHAAGRALDIMTDSATGDQIAAYLQKNYRALGLSQVIWQQRIWTVQLASSGWRSMSDRGSATANHMDHVHATTYGNSGTS